MGFIVNGFCHAAVADARLALRDESLVRLTGVFPMDTASETPVLIVKSVMGDSTGTVARYGIFDGYTGSALDTIEFTIPSCEAEYEGGFMPWAQTNSPLAFQMNPLLAGSLLLAALPCFVIAHLMRISRGLS